MDKQIITNRWLLKLTLNSILNEICEIGHHSAQSIQEQYKKNIIDRSSYIIRMMEVNDIKMRLEMLPSRFTVKDFLIISPQTATLKLYKYRQTIIKYALNYGCTMECLTNILDIKPCEFLDFHSKVFFPTRVINNPEEYKDLAENLKEKGCFVTKLYPAQKNCLIEQLSGAQLYFPNENIKIVGYYDDDPVRFSAVPTFMFEKQVAIKHELIHSKIAYKFASRISDSLSLRDLMTSSPDEVLARVTSCDRDLKTILSKTPKDVIEMFNKGSLEYKRKLIVTMYSSGTDRELGIAGTIFDTFTEKGVLEYLTYELPWSVQQDIMLKQPIKRQVIKMAITDYNDISLEEQIVMVDTSDENKEKAFMKIKEMRGSRENSSKAEHYVHGFIKLPFGKFKKEEIFEVNRDCQDQLVKLIEAFIDDMKEYKDEIEYILIQRIVENFKASIAKEDKSTLRDDTIVYSYNLSDRIDDLRLLKSTNREFTLDVMKHWLLMSANLTQYDDQKTKKKEYINQVEKTLDISVHGHKEAKLQLKRLVAQWMTGKMEGAVFGFQGPPGVGKTSLAKHGLSKCLVDDDGTTRPFCFLPVGGATNGSMLEGHSYTYVGSTWGRIVDMLMDSKCMNPVIYIDELDKISSTESGREIISILTHMTDPTQNSEYFDRYFSGIALDLSKILFVFSYNDASEIDPVLKDRITEISVDPLTLHDKKIIVNNYLLPEIIKMVGLNPKITMDDDVIEYIVESYTYEAGVRKLKEILLAIVRHINLEHIMGHEEIEYPKKITKEEVESVQDFKNKVRYKKISNVPLIGVINGMYATATGIGGITIIQVLFSQSKTHMDLELTGLQGDVMKESMSCAKTLSLSLIKEKYRTKLKEKEPIGLHIHCPSGGTKKDGPSAGAAITCAILSRMCDIPINNTVAMTGEIDLGGNVTAIGGLDTKIQGAMRAGVTKILAPEENREDYERFLNQIEDMDLVLPSIVFVNTIHDVLPHVFGHKASVECFNKR